MSNVINGPHGTAADLVQPSPQVPQDDTGGVLSFSPLFLQYWQAVIRWRWVILGIIGASLAIGLISTLLMAPLYTARSQIEVSREKKNVTSVKGLESANEANDAEFYATQYALLKAQSLAQRVMGKLKLAENPRFFAAHGVDFEKIPVADTGRPRAMTPRQRTAMSLLLGNVAVSPIRTSRLIDISYTSRDPELSARIANAWPQEFIGATMDRGFASTADARKFLDERLNQLRQKLQESERAVVTYTTNEGIVTLSSERDSNGRTFAERTLASSELEALNKAYTDARSDRIAAESRNQAGAAESSPEVLSNPAIATLRARRAEAAAEYAKTLVQFEPGYPVARALKQQIDSLDSAIARETNRIGSSRRLAYTEAAQRERELFGKVEAMKKELSRQSQAAVQKNIFQREADTNRELYDSLLQRYKEIGVAGTVGASNMAIVDIADVPTGPSGPRMGLNLVVAFLIGASLAILAVIGLEQVDKGIRNPEDVRNFLKMPLLGNVPLTEGSPLEELEDPKSHLSDAYFSIRSTLAFSTSHGLPKSVVVTSTQPGEGKSTTSVALAEVIGRTGKKVVLIDGDLRSPSIHKYVGIQNTEGLSNLLAGSDIQSVVKSVGDRGLSVITAGPIPPSPAELLSSDRFGELIGQLLEVFDHIVIDGPPVLGMADAPSMARAVEGVVYVAEAERTSRRAILGSLQRLTSVGSHILGLIVTKIDYSKHSLGYGYGFDYGYGSGYGYGYGRRYGADKSKA